MPHPLHIVDVFAEEKYAGNQLAVVLDAGDLDAGDLDGAAMQRIAFEMNFSETTFVLASEPRPLPDGGGPAWPVRIFTPRAELPFAGHPTLGTAWVIREHLLDGQPDTVTLDLAAGAITVTARPPEAGESGAPVLWMRQLPPTFGRQADREAAAAAIGLTAGDLDPELPVQEVSTGTPFLIVPVASEQAVVRAQLERPAYYRLLDAPDPLDARALLFFARGEGAGLAGGTRIKARVYADALGVPEDPATGSANGCLAGYLSHHRVLGGPEVAADVEQGAEIGRPSLLRLRAAPGAGGEIEIEVGGRVAAVAEGRLL